MFTKLKFQNLSKEKKEKAVAAFFKAKFAGFQVTSGINISVPAGYNLRIAAQLVAEEEKEIIKKVFVVLQEFNDYITKVDVDTVAEYAEQLHQAGLLDPTRDELWLVTNQRWTYEAFAYAKGKIVLMDIDALVDGILKILSKENRKSAELIKNLERLGISV